jgi:thiamine-phosphate diphosphorylase
MIESNLSGLWEVDRNPFPGRVYPILDLDTVRKFSISEKKLLSMWKAAGIRSYQFRAKSFSEEEYLSHGEYLHSLEPSLKIIANDHLKLALNRDDLFSGIHLGQEDLELLDSRLLQNLEEKAISGRILCGVSTHSIEELSRISGAFTGDEGIKIHWTYIAVGPVFQTISKKENLSPVLNNDVKLEMISLLKRIRGGDSFPEVVFIGGISAENIKNLLDFRPIRESGIKHIVSVIGAAARIGELSKILDIMSEYNA